MSIHHLGMLQASAKTKCTISFKDNLTCLEQEETECLPNIYLD